MCHSSSNLTNKYEPLACNALNHDFMYHEISFHNLIDNKMIVMSSERQPNEFMMKHIFLWAFPLKLL